MAKAEAETVETRGKFRVNEKSFVGHALVEEGSEVFIDPDSLKVKGKADGHISDNLSPLNDVAQAMVDNQKEDHPDKSAAPAPKAAKAPAAAKPAKVEGEAAGAAAGAEAGTAEAEGDLA
jgi:hypothetical protein